MILRIFFLSLFTLGLLAFWYYTNPIKRNITIEATTESLSLVLLNETHWRLEKAVVCPPASSPRTRASATSEQLDGSVTRKNKCGSNDSSAGAPLVVKWPRGTTLTIRRVGLGPLEILVGQNAGEIIATSARVSVHIVPDTSVFVMPTDLSSLSSLDFVGNVQVGTVVGSGTKTLLLNGHYEIREVFQFRSSSEIIRSAKLMMGDQLSLIDQHGSLDTSSGFIAIKDPSTRGFDLLLTGTSDHGAALIVERRGFDTTVVMPRWTERALADSVGLAITALLGFLLTVITIASEIINLKKHATHEIENRVKDM